MRRDQKKIRKKPTSTVCQFNQMILKRIFFYRLTSQLRLKCCWLLVKWNGVSFPTFALFLVNRTTHVNRNICSQVSILFYLGSVPFLIFHEFFLLLYFIASSQIFFAKNYLYWFFHKKKICMLYNQYFWEHYKHFVYANIIQYKK